MVFTNSGEMDGTVTASSLVDVSLWVAYAKEIQGAVVQIERELATHTGAETGRKRGRESRLVSLYYTTYKEELMTAAIKQTDIGESHLRTRYRMQRRSSI